MRCREGFRAGLSIDLGFNEPCQVALLLQKNGIQPWPDRITDFLKAETTGPQRRAPLAEVTVR